MWVSTFAVAGTPAEPAAPPLESPDAAVSAAGHEPALHLAGARLSVDGEPVLGPISVQQSRFGYLYFYVPGRGLYTIGRQAFDGAERAGTFRGERLSVEAGGASLLLESSIPILSCGEGDAWVHHEPDIQLNVQGVLYGYGDAPSIAAQWRDRFGGGGG
ncbi:MAG TPA: hypothetical protein VFE05_17290 [Longimicrobiaceae bacterium]|nr:hypothetical protein [Longimicrobiaceae bacterium]